MQVNGSGFSSGTHGVGRGTELKQQKSDPVTSETEASTAPASEKLRPAHGVLRLLQEGHFKGVADVRLRINFADELAALQAQSTRAGAEGGAATILEPADAVIEEFLGQEGLDETLITSIQEAAQAFRDAVNGLFDAFDPAADSGGSDLASAIEDAFQAFVEALQELAPQEGPEEVVPVETPEETTNEIESEPIPTEEFGFGEFIDRLSAAFEEAIVELRESFQAAQILPELSGPNGNGGAYAKFLEILNGLTGGGGDDAAPSVDTAA